MTQYNVQYLRYSSRGGFVCYPKVVANDRVWDARSAENWGHWTLDIDQSETVDLIKDAGFSEGDSVMPWIDVVAGNDACSFKSFIVTKNGSTASFDASGTTLNTSLTFTGTST